LQNKEILVTIICPVYNAEKFIVESIFSILKQTYKNFELIIIDDNSIDNTSDKIRKIIDPRITLIKNEMNLGPASSINIGIQKSSGSYIAIMHGDDIAMPNRISEQLFFMEENKEIDVLGSNYETIDESGEKIEIKRTSNKNINERLLFHNVLCHPTIFYRASIFNSSLIYTDGMRLNEDYDFLTKAVQNNIKISILQKVLMKYRLHSSQQSNIKSKEEFINFCEIRRDFWNNLFPEKIYILDFYENEDLSNLRLYFKNKQHWSKTIDSFLIHKLHNIVKSNKELKITFTEYLSFVLKTRFNFFSFKTLFRYFFK
jgi:glycosyltransferase involved in cell wall biosynthesis